MSKFVLLNKNLGLYITNNCNFRCRTCIREYGKSKNLDIKLLSNILKESKALGYTHVGLTGGEPCLHPEFDKIIEIIVQNGITFNITSNGSLRDKYKPVIGRYKDYLKVINLSIDGATREINDRVRGEGAFENFLTSIKYYRSEGIPIVPNVTLCKINKHQIENIVKLAVDLGLKEILISAAIKNSINKDIILSDSEKMSCFNMLSKVGNRHNIRIQPGGSLFTRYDVDNCVNMLFLSSPLINPEGGMSFCCNTIREGAVLGSLYTNSFTDLYKKCLDISTFLRKTRTEKIVKKEYEEGLHNCEFCNKYLINYIKK